MKITCTSTFMDGRDRFEAGETRVVSDERGAYFCAQGWASCEGVAQPAAVAADVTLDIQNVTHKTEVTHG